MDEIAERELIRRFQAGDRSAYDKLVEAHQRQLISLALQMLRNEEAALDVAQEVFMRAFEELPRWRGEARFGTWLYRTSLNVCYERIRADEKQRRIRNAAPEQGLDRSPEDRMLSRELRETINQAVNALPPRQRAIFVLKQYEGLRFTEIASLLEITEGGAKASYHKALLALKVHLKGYLPEYEAGSGEALAETADNQLSNKELNEIPEKTE